jgi:ribosomal-protein-alanine N-acetyltransferase
MAVQMTVAQATPMDAALLARLHAACFAKSWDKEAMATFIAGPGTLCLVGFAEDDERRPVGLLIVRRAADEAELLTIGVVPSYRRRGIAKALLERAMKALREAGVTHLFLEVDKGNMAALSLYRTLGAGPVGQRPGYYENGADAAIFSLALSESRSDDGPIADEPREDQR